MSFDLVSFKKNTVEKMPLIMKMGIGYFSQLSSFDKFGEIIILISLLEQIGKNPISSLDTKEEVEKYSSCEEFEKFIILAEIFTKKLNNIYLYLENKTSMIEEEEEEEEVLIELDKDTIISWENAEKTTNEDSNVGEAWQ